MLQAIFLQNGFSSLVISEGEVTGNQYTGFLIDHLYLLMGKALKLFRQVIEAQHQHFMLVCVISFVFCLYVCKQNNTSR